MDVFKLHLAALKPLNLTSHLPRPGWALLDQQGCAWELDPEAKRELIEAAIETPWNPYPDQHMAHLKQHVLDALSASKLDIGNVCIGNGSMELLNNLFVSCARTSVLYIEPSFFGYQRLANTYNYEIIAHPIDGQRGERFYIDIENLCQTILRHRPGLVLLHLPHSPTGVSLVSAELISVITAADQVGAAVILDQVYLDPFTQDYVELLHYPNVILNRAFGKMWSLSGLRCGFMVGSAKWMQVLESVRLPFSVNTLTQTVLLALLRRPELLARLRVRRDADTAAFHAMLPIHPLITRTYPSKASFLLFENQLGAEFLYRELQARRVAIRWLQYPGWKWALSVTAVEKITNARFFAALDDIEREQLSNTS